jgi:hypothetical protein
MTLIIFVLVATYCDRFDKIAFKSARSSLLGSKSSPDRRTKPMSLTTSVLGTKRGGSSHSSGIHLDDQEDRSGADVKRSKFQHQTDEDKESAKIKARVEAARARFRVSNFMKQFR